MDTRVPARPSRALATGRPNSTIRKRRADEADEEDQLHLRRDLRCALRAGFGMVGGELPRRGARSRARNTQFHLARQPRAVPRARVLPHQLDRRAGRPSLLLLEADDEPTFSYPLTLTLDALQFGT